MRLHHVQVACPSGGEDVALGYVVDDTQRHTFPGFERLHTFDGHGNRVELLADAPNDDARAMA